MAETIKTSDTLARERTDLAVERTMMAADRTLMAWTRTALSMISFGFTIYKFMQYMQQEGTAIIKRPHGPRNFGLALISLGIVSLLIACLQHWQLQKRIDPDGKAHFSLVLIVAGFIAAIGLLAILSVVFKIGPF